MASLAEIAKKAGVSSAVVSRIINNDKTLRVGAATRERVERAIREMDYAPNVAAQSLRSAKSGTIAIVMHDVANPVYGEILRGAQEEAEAQNKAILLGDAAVGQESNSRLAQMIGGGGVEGLILQAAGLTADNLIVQATRNKVPTVLLQSDLDFDAQLVLLPDETAARMATEHLHALGHRRIGCLATTKGLTFTENRLRGWRGVMGADARPAMLEYCGPTAAEGEAATHALLSRNTDMTALVCFNVVASIGALRAARSLGLSVPSDLSIVAIHDVKFAQDLRVPLTVVRMPLAQMGMTAVRLVLNPPDAPKTVQYLEGEPQLVVRQSTSAPRR